MELSNVKITDVLTHGDFILGLGNFLDEFKRSCNKIDMIAEEPKIKNADRFNLCALAAISHKLAVDNNIPVPEWVFKDIYKMPYPVYEFNTRNKDFQKYLIDNAPVEFSSKNIFYTSDSISRA